MLYELFQGNEHTVGRCQVGNLDTTKNKMEAKAWTENRSPTIEDFEEHIKGGTGVGVSPIMQDGFCNWGAIDIDYYSKKYINKPWFFCTTKSGGIHIYVFFKTRTKAVIVKSFLTELAALLGFKISPPDPVEIFPKQQVLSDKNHGNWINLPYHNNGEKRYCVYNGVRLSMDQFIETVKANKIEAPKKELVKHFILAGSPPCLQTIASNGIQHGFRSVALLNIARFLKLKYPDSWELELKKVNNEMLDVPFDTKEFKERILKSLKTDYKYACKSDLKPYCLKDLCVKRPFGVAKLSTLDSFLTAITKVETMPPYYKLTVESGGDSHIVECSSEDIMASNVIRKLIFEVTDVMLLPIDNSKYIMYMNELMEKAEKQPAPHDATEMGEIESQILEFFKERQTDEPGEVVRGRAYRKEDNLLFIAKYLVEYLKNHGFKGIKQNKLFQQVKRLGADNGCVLNIRDVNNNKKSVRVWSIPITEDMKEGGMRLKEKDWSKEDNDEF